jgi:hypothetical protein
MQPPVLPVAGWVQLVWTVVVKPLLAKTTLLMMRVRLPPAKTWMPE